jgi:hypothetical protein
VLIGMWCECIADERPTFLCLQETKLHVINDFNVLILIGHDFDYAFLPSIQTHGSILTAFVFFMVGL